MRRLPFFPAIEGLRGLAVVAVLLFHSGVPGVGGGFLGVSTFFTLSGFLITGLLTSEREAGGRIRLRAFWGRRFRRLMPAALLGLFLIAALGTAFGDYPQQERLRHDGFAALFYVANWWLIGSGAVYADLMGTPSFIQHFWSLAIEEQYYAVFPVVAALLLRFGRRAPLAVALGVGTLASWVWMLDLARSAEIARVYYGTDTRCGELLIGGVLALLLSGRKLSTRQARGLAALGVGGLLVSVVLWAVATVESAWLYRWGLPLYGLASVGLIAGCVAPGGPVRSLLCWTPLRWVGLVSYGAYVFHWPIFLVIDARSGLDPASLFVVRIALTFGLAAASHRWLEEPILAGRLLPGWRSWLAGLVAFAAIAVAFEHARPATRDAWRVGSTSRILTVGDSHTFGSRLESYPKELQELLDASEPGVHSILNLGLPGTTTSALRRQVPEWLSLYEPDVLVVWAGVNDAWKPADEPESGLQSRLSRMLTGREVETGAVANLLAIVESSASADTRVVFVTYPLSLGWFGPANVAMCEAARLRGVPLVDSSAALARLSPWERGWGWAMHPGPLSYREIARDVSRVILDPARGFVSDEVPIECLEPLPEHMRLVLRAMKQFAVERDGQLSDSLRATLTLLQQLHGTHFDLDALEPVPTLDLAAAGLHPRLGRALVGSLIDIAERDRVLDPAEERAIRELADELRVSGWERSDE